MSPSGLAIGFLLPVFLAIIVSGAYGTDALTLRSAVFLKPWHMGIGVCLIIAMAIGSKVGEKIELKSHASIIDRNWKPVLWSYGLISLGAYIFWFKNIFFSPSTLLAVLTGSLKLSRSELSMTAGVTSLVNLLPIYFAIVSHLLVTTPNRVPTSIKLLSATLFVLTLFRVYVWSERLALIELLVATLLPFILQQTSNQKNKLTSRIILLGPIIGIPALILYFGAAEYFRSWQSDFYNTKSSFWGFAISRLGSYYYTSLNNGAGLLELFNWPNYHFEYTLQFAHKAPALIGPLFRYYTNTTSSSIDEFLTSYADPEFNNPSGIYTTIFDLGIAGAFYYFSIIGFAGGILYTSFKNKEASGIVFYPLFFIMMLEVYRYPYFGSSRAFTSILGGFLAIWIMGRNRPTKNERDIIATYTATTVRQR